MRADDFCKESSAVAVDMCLARWTGWKQKTAAQHPIICLVFPIRKGRKRRNIKPRNLFEMLKKTSVDCYGVWELYGSRCSLEDISENLCIHLSHPVKILERKKKHFYLIFHTEPAKTNLIIGWSSNIQISGPTYFHTIVMSASRHVHQSLKRLNNSNLKKCP